MNRLWGGEPVAAHDRLVKDNTAPEVGATIAALSAPTVATEHGADRPDCVENDVVVINRALASRGRCNTEVLRRLAARGNGNAADLLAESAEE